MADFGSTKYNVSFEEWHELLMDYAELRGGSAADAEAWRDDYEAGKHLSKHIVMSGAMNDRDELPDVA